MRALCMKNDERTTGVLLFSGNRNMICCSSVSPEQRRKGTASKLPEKALDETDRNREITGSTFREAELTEAYGDPNQAFMMKGSHR